MVFKIAKFEFMVTGHYSLWTKCTQLWPLKCYLRLGLHFSWPTQRIYAVSRREVIIATYADVLGCTFFQSLLISLDLNPITTDANCGLCQVWNHEFVVCCVFVVVVAVVFVRVCLWRKWQQKKYVCVVVVLFVLFCCRCRCFVLSLLFSFAFVFCFVLFFVFLILFFFCLLFILFLFSNH